MDALLSLDNFELIIFEVLIVLWVVFVTLLAWGRAVKKRNISNRGIKWWIFLSVVLTLVKTGVFEYASYRMRTHTVNYFSHYIIHLLTADGIVADVFGVTRIEPGIAWYVAIYLIMVIVSVVSALPALLISRRPPLSEN